MRKEKGSYLTAGIVLIIVLVPILGYIHTKVIPLPMAFAIVNAYDQDNQKWEDAIEKEGLGDLGHEHEVWMLNSGGSFHESRYWQDELWANWPLYLCGGLFGLILLSFLVSSFSGSKKTGRYKYN